METQPEIKYIFSIEVTVVQDNQVTYRYPSENREGAKEAMANLVVAFFGIEPTQKQIDSFFYSGTDLKGKATTVQVMLPNDKIVGHKHTEKLFKYGEGVRKFNRELAAGNFPGTYNHKLPRPSLHLGPFPGIGND